VLTIAGTGKEEFADGSLKSTQFNGLTGICFDETEQSLFVCDFVNGN
jgi:hypothetical protein